MLVSCGPSVNIDRAGGDLAYSACFEAIHSVQHDFSKDQVMVIQIFDSGKRNGDTLKESKVFAYPASTKAEKREVSSACKVDMRSKKITSLSYKQQSVLEGVSEELRTF